MRRDAWQEWTSFLWHRDLKRTRLETLEIAPLVLFFRHCGRENLWKTLKIRPTKKHFFTLLPTLEEAIFAVKEYCEVKTLIFSMKSMT
jgi:hypothetical protein